nr:rhodanese-like domain-containing protein [Saprospiraceae bacterium]
MQEITPKDLRQKLEKKKLVKLLDVREPYENKEYNIGGVLIPLGELLSRLNELEEFKNNEVVVYCKSGNRSQMAQHLLVNAGFEEVFNLKGGMEAWKKEFDA